MVKRFLSVILLAGALIGMAIPAGASVSGSCDFVVNRLNSSSLTGFFEFPRAATSAALTTSDGYFRLDSLNVPPSVNLGASGTVSIYFSFYYGNTKTNRYYDSTKASISESVFTSNYLDPLSWNVSYYDMNGSLVNDVDSLSVSSFSVEDTSAIFSPGYSLKIRFSDVDYMSGLYIFSNILQYYNGTGSGNSFFVPSFTVVPTETSADVAALEDIADQIAEGNAIAQAMYGDIMAALNAISGDTTLIAEYMNECLTYLNSIKVNASRIHTLCNTYLKYLVDISNSSASIDTELKAYHEDFMSMMEMLQGTIMDESDDIQAKMEEIYNLLIAYLDSQYASAVNPDLIESTGDVQLDIDLQEDLESGFRSNLTESWTDLKLETFSLGSGYVSSVAWISSWFSNFYNAMGDYGMIVLLPLYIGIVTLVAGLTRQAIRRSGRADRSRGGKKDA